MVSVEVPNEWYLVAWEGLRGRDGGAGSEVACVGAWVEMGGASGGERVESAGGGV